MYAVSIVSLAVVFRTENVVSLCFCLILQTVFNEFNIKRHSLFSSLEQLNSLQAFLKGQPPEHRVCPDLAVRTIPEHY